MSENATLIYIYICHIFWVQPFCIFLCHIFLLLPTGLKTKCWKALKVCHTNIEIVHKVAYSYLYVYILILE